MLDIYQHLPQFINPIAFSVGSLNIRWYSLSYILGFLSVYLFLARTAKSFDSKKISQILNSEQISKERIHSAKHKLNNTVIDFLLVNFFAALVGGRLGYVLLYDFSYFTSHSLTIISPFKDGNLIGFYGMSFYGALLMVLAVSYIFLRSRKINFLEWADFIVPAVAIGYFFGRLGNFLNGELYGRATDLKIGMYFLADPGVLRHPSQLYEAIGEGLVLFLLIMIIKKINLPKGSLFSFYLAGYSFVRFFLEFFRQPDKQMGYYLNVLTIGQILSLIVFFVGIIMLLRVNRNFIKSE